ncbi:chemotaxis protein CheB [Magnetospirillum fulvum]|uniref:chemotaxis protein CheB n=1 Tax=Magnetospirillum fulvum TaxID=1082 RepID=UPI001FCD8FEA|nr:chemotaxis protein CheB [Magnetospirillum fulvum]
MSDSAQGRFTIVGIGASAGGLEALERFLLPIPSGCGLAFVVIQHLDPDQSSAIVSLLQRVTSMEVAEAEDGKTVRPNAVYVIPRNRDLSIREGRLWLLPTAMPHAPRRPVDHFFSALAEDQREFAIGVVLSGMGADGTLGLGAIKASGGLTLAQSPEEAGFDSMPKSAIEAGFVDIVAPASALITEILDCRRRPVSGLDEEQSRSALNTIIALLNERSRHDFTLYKTTTLFRRIERRVALHRLDSLPDYVRYLHENPREIDLLFRELLIGVTNFFRDPAVWDAVKAQILVPLVTSHPLGRPIRAWVPACSTGEEAYSLAIVFREILDEIVPPARSVLQIYATDLNAEAITQARQGVFPANIAEDVSPERLNRFFSIDARGYRIAKDIRDMVTFAEQNIISDPPFTKLDILSCRNLLIYFGPDLQKSLLPLFHFALNPDGALILGSAEAIGDFTRLFSPINQKARLFRRINHPVLRSAIRFPGKAVPMLSSQHDASIGERGGETLQGMMERILLSRFCPAAVLVDSDGEILYFSGRTGRYLEPAAGKANLNLHVMARDGIRLPLISAIKRALRQDEAVVLPGLTFMTEGGMKAVTVTVQKMNRPESTFDLALVVFSDVECVSVPHNISRKAARSRVHDAMSDELAHTRAELDVTRAEMQASLEELKSANEEQQATNEELQSANEELITSKEEMQSMNEELHSVNAEMQSKVENLVCVNNDMSNLLNSTEIAMVFLDGEMRIRRFTPYANQLFKLIDSDSGRPLSDIVTDLRYPTLTDDAREVLRTLIFIEKQVPTQNGRWVKVRTIPYRTQDNVIDGVAITFIDVTEIKELQDELKRLKGETL